MSKEDIKNLRKKLVEARTMMALAASRRNEETIMLYNKGKALRDKTKHELAKVLIA